MKKGNFTNVSGLVFSENQSCHLPLRFFFCLGLVSVLSCFSPELFGIAGNDAIFSSPFLSLPACYVILNGHKSVWSC